MGEKHSSGGRIEFVPFRGPRVALVSLTRLEAFCRAVDWFRFNVLQFAKVLAKLDRPRLNRATGINAPLYRLKNGSAVFAENNRDDTRQNNPKERLHQRDVWCQSSDPALHTGQYTLERSPGNP